MEQPLSGVTNGKGNQARATHWIENDANDSLTTGGGSRVSMQSSKKKSHHYSQAMSNKVAMLSATVATSDEEGELNDDNVVVIKTTEEKLREAERIIATEVFNRNVVPESMTIWCASAGLFQLTQALILFFIALNEANHDNWYWFVSYPNPTLNDLEDAERKPELKQIASFSILWLIPLCPLLSGIQHLSTIVFRDVYFYYMERHQNPFRWTEYTLSAPLMKVIIAQQVGITDFHLLVSLFVLMAVSIQSPATHEAVNAKARSENRPQFWRSFFTGWIGHLTVWALIFNYASVNTSRNLKGDHEENFEGGMNGTVWALLWIQFVLDTSFAGMFTLQWKKIGFAKDYVRAEKGFLLLSFIAKTMLTWITVANVLRA